MAMKMETAEMAIKTEQTKEQNKKSGQAQLAHV